MIHQNNTACGVGLGRNSGPFWVKNRHSQNGLDYDCIIRAFCINVFHRFERLKGPYEIFLICLFNPNLPLRDQKHDCV